MTQAYPLQWQAQRQRKPAHERKRAWFSKKGHKDRWARELVVADALRRLQDELDRLGARYATISSNVELRLDGLPRSGQREPDDPGVCVYFELKGEAVSMPCDTFDRVADSIAAIAAHIEATRKQERYGVATVSDMFRGFMELPAPDAVKQWWDVLQIERTADRVAVESAWKRLRKERHPDMPTGSTIAFQELQAA